MAILIGSVCEKGKVLPDWKNGVIETNIRARTRSTFQVQHNEWARDLKVEVGGHGVVSHTGSVAVRALADRSGLTGRLSDATARRGFVPVHDRGRVLADTAVMIADGGRVLSDLAVLRDQDELFGSVASDPTLWRTLNAVDGLTRDKIAAARAKTRTHVWSLITERHGAIPAAKVADADLGKTIVVRLDASVVIAHSERSWQQGRSRGRGVTTRSPHGVTTPRNAWR